MRADSVIVDHVSKIYKSDTVEVRAIDDVSFTAKKGEFVAIVGPSGSGKSSLMHMLGTIDKPTSGEIYIDGIATSKMSGDQLAEFRNSKLGFVFQAFNLVNGLTAEGNVELPLMVNPISTAERRERASGLLTQLGLGERLNMKPPKLSGGEQQRVAVARALVNKPTLVLADEPTGDLDTKSGEGVVKLLREICDERGITIIMVTHNLEIIKYCDRVIYLRDGRKEKQVLVK